MKTKSIWGTPPKRLYKLIDLANKSLSRNFTTCIVGCSDGKFLMPFARKGHKVWGYDIDEIALFGGEKLFPMNDFRYSYEYSENFESPSYQLDQKRVLGITERLKIEKLEEFATIEKIDFYGSEIVQTFDVVFTSCSLHYSANQRFTLKEKVEKLQELTATNGILYIDYMMAIEESDYTKYSELKFFRKGEILKYFDLSKWEILLIYENNRITAEKAHVDCVIDHFHRFGYIMARRKK